HVSNSSGIGSQTIEVYWNAGSTTNIGSDVTEADGYFELSYVIPAGYEGSVTYWVNFTSLIPALTDTESLHLGTSVKRYDVSITIADSPDPIHLLQTVTIQGIATLPENASSPLAFVQLEIYWANSTYPSGILIGTTWTNSSGGYAFYYQIPLTHGIETVDIWTNFTSPYTNIADGESLHEPLQIELAGTLITVNSDATSYYLNETVQITGNLQFSNGTPLPNERVFIHWVNTSGTFIFEKFTDTNGDYQFQYNLSTSMDTGLVNVHVNWTSLTGLEADAFSNLAPPIQLNKYDLQIVTIIPTQLYLDEILDIQGILSYLGGSPPLVGEIVELSFWNGLNWQFISNMTTNSTGGFNQSIMVPLVEYTWNFRLQYNATDPLNNNVTEYFDVTFVKYAINLEISVLPNPVMQNETITVHAYLYYAHNGTPVSFADVSIYWDNGTLFWLGNITTDGTGHGDLTYSGMDYDTIRSNIHVYGNYAGTTLQASNESIHTILTIDQWESDLVGLNTPFAIYNLLDTVVVSGTLWCITSADPFSGATVELLVSGIPVNSTITASDGTFTLNWKIPSNTPIGFYDLEVRYLAPYPWILGIQEFVPTIEITAPGYIFVSFTVSPEAPAQVIVLDNLTITGIVTWDNGSIYAFSSVSLYWGDPLGTYFLMENVMTDGAGAFTTNYQVLGGTALGIRQVWAYIPPAGIATYGISLPRSIDIQVYSLVITATVDITTAHLGDTITISGTAHFSNGTPLTGHDIEIWWDSNLLSTESVDGFGNFSYAHLIPYTDSVGINSGYALFNAPTAAFPDISTNFADVEVREYIDLYMNIQPASNTFLRGDTITITGYVENDGGFAAIGVEIRALRDGGFTGTTDDTDIAGLFSIQLTIPDNWAGDQYIITIETISQYRDVLSTTGSWTIIVVIDSTIDVRVSSASFMPEETFTIQLQLFDEDGAPINGASIEIYLNMTLIDTVILADGSGSVVTVTIPTSWSNNGYFVITVDYAGNTYLNGDSDVSADTIHIFTDISFENRSPNTVTPGLAFIIEVRLTDSDLNVIVDRSVILTVDGTNIVTLSTDAEGVISYDQPGHIEGIVEFSFTLTSTDAPQVTSVTFEIMIQTQGGNILQGIDLIIAGILLVGAVIAVLAYLY
ncbi:MAG: hypothetical protein ACTSYJ_01160, partial [Candidatus Thorarchaeota archaeon]